MSSNVDLIDDPAPQVRRITLNRPGRGALWNRDELWNDPTARRWR